jgi:hypothetical protein
MSRREKSELTESGGVVRLQQAAYFAGTLCWLIFVVVVYLTFDRNNKPGLGPTVIMISLGPLVMGFFVAGWGWIFCGGLHHFFSWGTFCVSLALLITYPVVMFMDDIAGASPGLIVTVLMTAACAGFMFGWVTNKSGIRNALSQRNSSGFVSASVGLVITTLTLVGVAYIQLVNPVPPEGVFFLLALGGIPATIAMLLGLWQGFHEKRMLLASASGPINSSGIRIAGAGLGLLLLGVVIFAGDFLRRQSLQRQWFADAQVAVEEVLHSADRIPADMRKRLGPYQGLTTRGIGGWQFLRTDGEAQFNNGMIPVRIYVTCYEKTNDNSQEVVVRKVERNNQLYPFFRGETTSTMEGLEFWVLHPDVKEL